MAINKERDYLDESRLDKPANLQLENIKWLQKIYDELVLLNAKP